MGKVRQIKAYVYKKSNESKKRQIEKNGFGKSGTRARPHFQGATVRGLLWLRLRDLLEGVVVHGLREGGPRGVVLVLGLGGEQLVAALAAAVHA